MTLYTLLVLALAVLAPLPWIGLYRLDRRCAEGVGTGRWCDKGKVASANVGLPLSADRRPAVSARSSGYRAGTARPGDPM